MRELATARGRIQPVEWSENLGHIIRHPHTIIDEAEGFLAEFQQDGCFAEDGDEPDAGKGGVGGVALTCVDGGVKRVGWCADHGREPGDIEYRVSGVG